MSNGQLRDSASRVPLAVADGTQGAGRAAKLVSAPCTLSELLVWLVETSREYDQRRSSKSTAPSISQLPSAASCGRC
jgi:hypothetical protein